MVENRTKIGELFVSFYLNEGKKSIILANGIPSYITKHHPLVTFCIENKINLFIPRYYGSFESGGEFSLKNCSKTMEDTLNLVLSGKTKELFGNKEISWDTEEIFVLGYSFGALPVLNSKIESTKQVKIILDCPFINLDMNTLGGGSAKEELEYIERAYPFLYRFKAEKLKKEYEKVSYPEKKEFLLVIGKKDKTISQEEKKFLMNRYAPKTLEFDGGHTIDLATISKVILEL